MSILLKLIEMSEFWVQFYNEFPEFFIYAILGAVFILLIFSWYYIVYFFLSFKKIKRFPKGETKFKYAVLIPARNEDQVIGKLLDSLKNQTYPAEYFDVYVIVESKDDPTCKITKKYGYDIVIRKDLQNKRTKGFALDEAYHHIKELGRKYDAYMIFDADNIVTSEYIDLLNDVKNVGYQVGMGYRNFTNASTNWISACSGALFTYMNEFTSKGRSRLFKKVTLTGTGYYVNSDIIDNVGGWIFDGMTEDVQLTSYCYYHNISMNYYPDAQYFDEQPTKFSVIHKQHIRWVWGFFSSKKRFKKKDFDYGSNTKLVSSLARGEYTFNIYPIIICMVINFLAFAVTFGLFIASFPLSMIYPEMWASNAALNMGLWSLFYLVIMHIGFMCIAILTFIIGNKYLKYPLKLQIKVALTYMIFFGDFLYALLDGLTHPYKRRTWDKIPHSGEVTDLDALDHLSTEERKKQHIRVIKYDDPLNDDFQTTALKRKPVPENYKYERRNKFNNFLSAILFWGIAKPILGFIALCSGVKIEGKENLKELKSLPTGAFIYANHTSFYDAFIVQALIIRDRRTNIIGFTDVLSMPLIRNIVRALGYLPVDNSLKAQIKLLKALGYYTQDKKQHVLIYPEAHIWPYYTKIRDFKEGSFHYPAKYNAPVIPFVTVFIKHKNNKKPKRKILVGKLIYPNPELSLKDNKLYLHEECLKAMKELASSVEQYEYIKYYCESDKCLELESPKDTNTKKKAAK